jgi:hypothetical protein
VGGYHTSGYAEGVMVLGNYAYVADGLAGLHIIDVSNPSSPVRVGGYDTSGYAFGVAVSGNYAYVADSSGGLVILRVANVAPVADAGQDQTIEANAPWGAKVHLDGSNSSDEDSTPGTNDDINDFNWFEQIDPCDPNTNVLLGSGQTLDCNLPLGKHTIVLEVTDKAGASDSNEVTIIVQDTTPPQFSLSVTPTILWPANKAMVRITPTWTVSDLCDPDPTVSLVNIQASEPANGDIRVDPDGSIYLRAWRSGNADGRIYTITFKAVDDSGNSAQRSAIVTVPHDQHNSK